MRRFVFTLVGLLAVSMPARAHAQAADTSFSLPRNAVVDITLRSRDLIVRGTDRSAAELRGGDDRYSIRASGVGVIIEPRDERSRSRARGRDNSDGALELLVPRGVRVVISAGTADVTVDDIAGDVEVHSLSGDVELRAIGGRAIVETLSGEVRLSEGANGARVTTMSGDITLGGVRGTADLHTTSGDVSLGVVRATQVQIETVSGEIDLDGDLADGARVQLTSHSGDVSVRIPESAHGVMEMSTFSGDLSANRPLSMMAGTALSGNRSERGTKRYEFGGGGTTRVIITTFNGDVQFDRSGARSPD